MSAQDLIINANCKESLTDKTAYVSVIAGLAVGSALIVVFASMFSTATAKTDNELILDTKNLREVKYFLQSTLRQQLP